MKLARPISIKSFFLAGVMQGSRSGRDVASQCYRVELSEIIRRNFPTATIHDPGIAMWENLQSSRQEIRDAHTSLAHTNPIKREEFNKPLEELMNIFQRETLIAATCDVCVVYLPQFEASMGTAIEMYAAYRANRTVVTITPMRQNLAVLACSSILVDNISQFDQWCIATSQAQQGAL